MDARPDVFNHNLETVPRLYLNIRPGARYFASLRLLQKAKELVPTGFTKSGLMVGLGESREEIMQVMDDLRAAGGRFPHHRQYLQPTKKHAELQKFWTPDEFKALEVTARRERLPDGLGLAAHALVLSCRQRLRGAESCPAVPPDVTTHSETRIVPYTADLMFRVVADVEQVSEIPALGVALRVLSRERVRGRDVLYAEMAVGYGALREKYTSRVILDPAQLSIDVAQTSGPFRQLENHWRFTPAASGCQFDFLAGL